jgi:hypothetical protein
VHASSSGLGWNPLHAVRRAAGGVAHGVSKGARGVEHGAVKVGKFAVKAALAPAEFSLYLTKAATRLALRPVTSRIRTLENRRANKIAWDARKSRTPTPAERSQAKAWTKAKLRHELPHGPLLALLAGAPSVSPAELGQFGMSTNLGIAPAVIAALIPVFIALMNSMLRSFSKSGEAPIMIGPDGRPIIPPGMDVTMPDPAAEAAVNAGDDGPAGGPDDGSGGAPGDGMVPGGPVNKNHVLLFGGIVLAIVVVSMATKKKPAAKK